MFLDAQPHAAVWLDVLVERNASESGEGSTQWMTSRHDFDYCFLGCLPSLWDVENSCTVYHDAICSKCCCKRSHNDFKLGGGQEEGACVLHVTSLYS